jgi:hypothetical protein
MELLCRSGLVRASLPPFAQTQSRQFTRDRSADADGEVTSSRPEWGCTKTCA